MIVELHTSGKRLLSSFIFLALNTITTTRLYLYNIQVEIERTASGNKFLCQTQGHYLLGDAFRSTHKHSLGMLKNAICWRHRISHKYFEIQQKGEDPDS